MCIALARAPTWQSGRSASAHAGRPDRKHRRVAWVRAVRWRCRPGLAVNMDQIGTYFNKVLISIVSLSGILTWTPHNDPFVAMYSQWLASGRPGGLLCVRLVWCGLYDGAAYLSTSESYLRDLGVVRLIPRAAYSPEITVITYFQKVLLPVKIFRYAFPCQQAFRQPAVQPNETNHSQSLLPYPCP